MTSQDISKDLNLHDRLFENLVTVDELLAELKGKYAKNTIYKWVSLGLPKKNIRGRLYFSLEDVATWMKRTRNERV